MGWIFCCFLKGEEMDVGKGDVIGMARVIYKRWARKFWWHQSGWIFMLVMVLVLLCGFTFAADLGRYQVVAGSEDSGYLVDTETGAVWILTHRALPTGREPVAIPYKFIQISPKDRNEFIVESVQEAPASVRGK
jgi:hypothetical protein